MGFVGNKQKKVKIKNKRKVNFVTKNVAYNVVIMVILAVSFLTLVTYTAKYKKEVSVVSLKEDIGANMLTDSLIVKKNIPQSSLEKGMILWKDREEKVVNKYPNMQIRPGVPIYDDMITDQPVIKYNYLYDLGADEELLTFKYDSSMAAGRIPVPGDRFRIRGSYSLSGDEMDLIYGKDGIGVDSNGNIIRVGSSDKFANTDTGTINATSTGTDSTQANTDINKVGETDYIVNGVRKATIFDVATVVDMLNSRGDSIYEILKQYKALTPVEQEKMQEDGTFKDSIAPQSLLLIVKSAQADKFLEFSSSHDVDYLLTLLSRDEKLKEEDFKMPDAILEIQSNN